MTNKQIQHLLAYLGYYKGQIDGILGRKSKAAIEAFQNEYGGIAVNGDPGEETQKALKHAVAHGMPTANEQENFWDGIKYFDREEFRCKCGGKYCDGFPVEPEKKLLILADRVREHFGVPAVVSSGVRCKTRNANVSGAAASRHMAGKAMDFCVRNKPASAVLSYVLAQTEVRYAYAIDSNYIHMDIK